MIETKSVINEDPGFSIWTKLNPIWWFGNYQEPVAPDWYLPGRAQWRRNVAWYLRNPLQNFSRYVIGVNDKSYTITGTAPVLATTLWDDAPGTAGWKWSVISLGWLRLPFVSYESSRIKFYIGWQSWGFAGAKFNLKTGFNLW